MIASASMGKPVPAGANTNERVTEEPAEASSTEARHEPAPTAAAPPPTPDVTPAPPTHCPYRQAVLLQQALAPSKMRVGFFLGAGCPLSIRVPDGDKSKPLIPDIAGLTAHVRTQLEASDEHKAPFQTLIKRLDEAGNAKPTIEDLLSHIRALRDVVGKGNIDGLNADTLDVVDAEICATTTALVSARLPSDDTPYNRLASWVAAIERHYAVELFTSNYDLLVEQALETSRVPYFDGFVGSDRTFFDLPSIEHDRLPPRWARLWKVHGSINWWHTKDGSVQRRANSEEGDRLLIHPSHLKYLQSRRMPYLAMLDRLRTFLTQGQAVLVTCGYSFIDQHINEVILQGLSGNPLAICFGLIFGDRATCPEAVQKARTQANLNVLAVDGAVIGTIERDWHSVPQSDHPLHGLAVQLRDSDFRSSASKDRCKFLLGDFKAFGEFLAHQLAGPYTAEGSLDGR